MRTRTNLAALGPLRFVAPEPSPWDQALKLREVARDMAAMSGRPVYQHEFLLARMATPRVRLAWESMQ